MANVWFISDLHWGHKNICRFRTQFSSEEEHRLTIKENILSCVRKRDTLWILGDSVFTEECLPDLKDIVCTKKLVIGNHCGQNMHRLWSLYECFDAVYGLRKQYGAWLSHAPIHPDELRGSFCVHGHTHNHIIQRDMEVFGEAWELLDAFKQDDPRYINMCVEHHNFGPRDLNWLRGEMEERRSLM